MFLRFFDMGSVVVLEKTDVTVSLVLKRLSEALNCNVFVDGLVDDLAPRPGAYRASDLLDSLSRLWKCAWAIEEGNVYLLRDFSRPNQFPDLSLGEVKEFARAVSARLAQKYRLDPAVGTSAYLKALKRDVRASLSPAALARLESDSGVRVGLLTPALQERVGSVLLAMQLGSAASHWESLSAILQDLDRAEFWVTGPATAQLSGPKSSQPLNLSLVLASDSAAVEALYQRLSKLQSARADSYAATERLKAPEPIRGHFVAGAAVVSEVPFYKGLAKLHGWKCQVGADGAVALEPKPITPNDDVLSLLPEEYRRYIAAGVTKANALYMTPTMEVRTVVDRLSQEGALLAGVLKKVLAGRSELRLSQSTELERYLVARIALNSVAQLSLDKVLLVDAFPDGYVSDSKNVYFRLTGENGYGFSYSGPDRSTHTPILASLRLFARGK